MTNADPYRVTVHTRGGQTITGTSNGDIAPTGGNDGSRWLMALTVNSPGGRALIPWESIDVIISTPNQDHPAER